MKKEKRSLDSYVFLALICLWSGIFIGVYVEKKLNEPFNIIQMDVRQVVDTVHVETDTVSDLYKAKKKADSVFWQ